MRDKDVRAALLRELELKHGHEDGTRVVEEMGVWSGSVRIDVAVINGSLSGFELKSDRDTLDRLPLQAEIYSQVFDHVSLVVGERHAARATEHVPRWWGVVIAVERHGSVVLSPVRDALPNPAVDPYLVAQLLWKDEGLAILAEHGPAAGWRSRRVREIHHHLARELTIDELRAAVREVLKRREGWLISQSLELSRYAG